MELPGSLAARAQQLGELVARIQGIASGVAERSRWFGLISLVAAPVAWLTLFGRWAFDTFPRFVVFAVILGIMALPGLALMTFAKAVKVTATQSDDVLEEVRGLLRQGGTELASGVSGMVGTSGLGQLGALLGSFWKLRKFGGELSAMTAKIALSTRLLNPLYLLWVAFAALAAGAVIAMAALGIILLVV